MKFFVGLCLIFISLATFAKVELIDHTGDQLEIKKLHFVDENGTAITLDTYFQTKKPVVLVPVYYECPGVCTVVLNNLIDALKQINASAGRGFEVVVLSINPKEGPSLAQDKKTSYLKLYERPETVDGWHFLTGDEDNIKFITNALGFGYEFDEKTEQFSHPSAVFILTPEGKISTTIAGITFSYRDVRMGLLQASQGKIEFFLNQLSAFCYAYMPHPAFINSPRRWLLCFLVIIALPIGYLVIRKRKIKQG